MESNQRLITLYCPNLAKSIFVVEKVFQKKGHTRFWMDPKQGTTESISSLSMMILILVEQLLTDEETAKNNPDHLSLKGFEGSPFSDDSDCNLRYNMEWATEGRELLKEAINLAERKTSFTTLICKEAKIIAQDKHTMFLSGKEKVKMSRQETFKRKAAKTISPSPRTSIPRDMPLFW